MINQFLIYLSAMTGTVEQVGLLIVLLLFQERRLTRRLVITSLAFVCFWLIGEVLKTGIASPRPCWNPAYPSLIPCPQTFSLPSGHALGWTMLSSFSWALSRLRRVRWFILLLTIVVCVSRVVLGVHQPIDVFTGVILGGIFGWLLRRFYW